MAYRLSSMMRAAIRKLCGHPATGPSGVFDQSNARINRPISPPPATDARGSWSEAGLVFCSLMESLPSEAAGGVRIALSREGPREGVRPDRGPADRRGLSYQPTPSPAERSLAPFGAERHVVHHLGHPPDQPEGDQCPEVPASSEPHERLDAVGLSRRSPRPIPG